MRSRNSEALCVCRESVGAEGLAAIDGCCEDPDGLAKLAEKAVAVGGERLEEPSDRGSSTEASAEQRSAEVRDAGEEVGDGVAAEDGLCTETDMAYSWSDVLVCNEC
jgi:hypothetical protein